MPRGRIYKIYAAITASIDAAAYITIQRNCTLRSIQIVSYGSAGSSGDGLNVEVSTAAARQLTTNDTQGPLAGAATFCALTTSGVFDASINQHIPCECDLKEGDRIYLHATEAGGGTWQTNVYLNVTETGRR